MDEAKKAAIDAAERLQKTGAKYWSQAKYTKSIVAVIDVMGTKELFLNDPNDFDSHKTIYKTWDDIEKRQKLIEYREYLVELYGDFGVKSTFISDSVVLSIDITVPNAFSKLMMILGLFSHSLLSLNSPYFTRGAIVVGNIYHEDNFIFGPALIKAHLMESNKAVNFRCITDDADYGEISALEGDTSKLFLDAFFYLDDDAYYCFDYLHRFVGYADNRVRVGDDPKVYLNLLSNIQRKIRNEKANHKRDGVRDKYLWMEKYFQRTLSRVISNSDDDEYIWLKDAYKNRKRK